MNKIFEATKALMRPVIANMDNKANRDAAIKGLAQIEEMEPKKRKRRL